MIISIRSYLLFLLLLIGSLGCELIEKRQISSQFSHYYLWIKSLSENELSTEIKNQQSHINNGYINAEINLAMLYSLPNSPIFNPFTAKTKLNKFAPTPLQAVEISVADFGFITMMKDQLNQQILTINKLEISRRESQETKIELNKKMTEHKKLLEQFTKLNKQMTQLKKIESNINNQE